LQFKQLCLLESITNCTRDLDYLEMQKREKDNMIKELELSINEARNSIKSAKDGRFQEISMLQQKLKESEDGLQCLQRKIEESLVRISNQNIEIRELTEKIEEYKFLNDNKEPEVQRGSLRGYSNYS
jgi:chromosome segregation ATPase